MKIILAVLLSTIGLTSAALAQSPSPTASGSPSVAASPTARTDMYHVHIAKSALGQAAEHAEILKKQDPDAPMHGHLLVLRHLSGDAWDYCVIEHLGTKATVDAARPAPSPAQVGLGDWHTDTFVNGPAWADFAKQMGIDDPSKTTASAYVVSIYRPEPGQRDALDKFLNEPPNRTIDTSSGNVVMQHMEGAAWTFLAIARYNNWNDFGRDQVNSIAQMNKKEGGWFKLRSLVSFHTDTLCDRITP